MKDLLGQELAVGDYVVSNNLIYQVRVVGKRSVKVFLVDFSKTTRPVNRRVNEVVKLDQQLVLDWMAANNLFEAKEF